MNNSAQQLGSKLAEKVKQDAALIEEAASKSQKSIETAQAQLDKHLKKLSEDVASTTRDVTTDLNKSLKASLDKATGSAETDLEKTISNHQDKISQQIVTDTKKLMWLIRFPFLFLLVALLVGAAALWVVTPKGLWMESTEQITMDSGKVYTVITATGWSICTVDGMKKPCKLKE